MKTIVEFLQQLVGGVVVFLLIVLVLGSVAKAVSWSISAVNEFNWVVGVVLGCIYLFIDFALFFVIWYAMHPSAPTWLSKFILPRKKTGSDAGLLEHFPRATLTALICVAMLMAVFAITNISTTLAAKGLFTYAIESHHNLPMSELLFRLYMWNTIELVPFVDIWKTYGITSPVRPTNFWAQTTVMIFRTVLIGFAISVIVRWIRFDGETSKTEAATIEEG
jgi:hypothetical protein